MSVQEAQTTGQGTGQGIRNVRLSAKIPVIDLNCKNAAHELLDAAKTQGFVFVKHSDISLKHEDVENMFKLSREFFASPQDIKAECTINSSSSGKNKGWLPMHGELLDPGKQKGDFKEAFNIGEFAHGRAQQPLPKPLQPHETDIGNFWDRCHMLCNDILELIAVALQIPDSAGGSSWFSQRHDRSTGPSGSVLRLLYYPALSKSSSYNPEQDIRAGAHSDYGSMTLLFRLPNQPGLEILTPQGEWATVPVDPLSPPGSEHLPILVNIGDILEYWTNGLLKSTVHRVIFPKLSESASGNEDRYSIAFFCHPLDDAQLIEIPSKIIADRGILTDGQTRDQAILTARDHLNRRLAATYKI